MFRKPPLDPPLQADIHIYDIQSILVPAARYMLIDLGRRNNLELPRTRTGRRNDWTRTGVIISKHTTVSYGNVILTVAIACCCRAGNTRP